MPTSARTKEAYYKLIVFTLAAAGALALGKLGSFASIEIVGVVVIFFIATSISFIRGTQGLYLVVFAILFSPEITTGFETGKVTGEGSGVVLRIEDIILAAVALGWMLRSAYAGRHFGIAHTPVNAPIWAYMTASIVATLLGLLRGSVTHFYAGVFHNLKYFEYFLLFFMILAHVRKKEVIVRMLWAMFIAFFLVMVYGYFQIPKDVRVSAPFDPEPNTFGGYIVLLMCVMGGIALVDKRVIVRTILCSLILFAYPPFLLTESRASYVAMGAGLLAFIAVSRHRIMIAAIVIALAAATVLGLPVLPERAQARVAFTFLTKGGGPTVEIGKVTLDTSSSQRLLAYLYTAEKFVESPFFGFGVTGAKFMDVQYPRLLIETGLLGLCTFLFMLYRLLIAVQQVYRTCEDRFLKGAAMGFFCGTIATMAHGLTANSFVIVRIAEPFWLLAGLILLIPRLSGPQPKPEVADVYYAGSPILIDHGDAASAPKPPAPHQQ